MQGLEFILWEIKTYKFNIFVLFLPYFKKTD